MSRHARSLPLAAALAALAALPAAAETAAEEPAKLKFYGDIRLRAEKDWDSLQSDGTKRGDRDRGRIRVRFGFNYAYDERWTFGGRLRSGAAQDQQSPHQTLGDELESKAVGIDKAFILGKWGPGWAWGGKNAFPFWTQNELFWDEDVNPEGLAAGCVVPVGPSAKLKPALGFFTLDNSGGNRQLGSQATLAAGQLAAEAKIGPVQTAGAAGLFAFKESPNSTDTALQELNYNIWVLGARGTVAAWGRPLSVGLDLMRNLRDYPPAVFNSGERTGYVAGLTLGQLKERNDWLAGYYYAHVEKLAVVARFAQDDWLRWGGVNETRSSNFAGHELRFAYALGPAFNAVARLYLVKGIAHESATAVSNENGKRFRLDLNMGF